jgi:hypothetical protein
MSVGGQFDSGTITPAHWKNLFISAKVSPSSYLATVQQIAKNLPGVFENIIEQHKSQYGETVFLNKIRLHQQKMIRRNLKLLET